MGAFIIRAVISALGLWVASKIVPGFVIETAFTLALAAVLLGVVNAIVRPIFFILTLPLTIVTLGLFILVVNGAMVGLVSLFLPGMDVGFWSAVWGALVIGLVSWVASWFIGDPKAKARD